MNTIKNTFSVSPVRFTVACMGMAAVWLFAPEIVHAAVTFGEIGQNIADNSKGVARGINGAMPPERAWACGVVWTCIRPRKSGTKHLCRWPDQSGYRCVGARS